MAPSVSYSVTARLDVASQGRAVSEITRAVEHAGGVVTGLDVNSGSGGRLRVDVTCAATDTAHAESLVAAMAESTRARIVTFGRSAGAEVRAADVRLDRLSRPRFTPTMPAGSAPVELRLHGEHKGTNALGAARPARAMRSSPSAMLPFAYVVRSPATTRMPAP